MRTYTLTRGGRLSLKEYTRLAPMLNKNGQRGQKEVKRVVGGRRVIKKKVEAGKK